MGKVILTWVLLLMLACCAGFTGGSEVGLCYGRAGDDLPTPDKVAQLVKSVSVKKIRIYDSNVQVLQAFANTSIELMIGIPNSDLLAFSQYQSTADTWVTNNVLPYYPATMITYVTVGAEVTESTINVSSLVVPAMKNVHTALKKAGLDTKIKVSSTHALSILSRSFPPSAGALDSKYAFFLKPLLEFLGETKSPFMVNVYPYYAYRDNPHQVSLDYALFKPNDGVIDPNTGFVYTNMFDAQIDALFFALEALNFRSLGVMITETGWPSKGGRKESAATPDNAATYNANLVRHVINNTGTPSRPGQEIDTYIFAIFNENRKPGVESERNWGLFYPDETKVYNVDISGTGLPSLAAGGNLTSVDGATWCIASSNANESDLQKALDWACGSGSVDCSPVQPGQPCYQPDNLASHASYVFNSYYQNNGHSSVACNFGGTGNITTNNPKVAHPTQPALLPRLL
ncbi:glucan endo-1,3-beta-glucosidase 13 isoform X2 [Cryptomeria japonica]|uniref:glucan endo-1,3-beta-glucosidase 13 isoform X2 n=1 Tax=Cryptomeria japonica TaxID=3369 RepID=UPI0027DA29CA|nr:glucan endo-1,3-beta-glucosidase 13 isoform X2 [Cryptomeria japonica]